jgi:IS30 family transposase
METHSLSDIDRAPIDSLTESNNRLAAALEGSKTEKVYSCKQAAQILGRSAQTISRYIRQGRIKKAVRGGAIGIPESEIMKLKPQ